jgi:hypothetical protein
MIPAITIVFNSRFQCKCSYCLTIACNPTDQDNVIVINSQEGILNNIHINVIDKNALKWNIKLRLTKILIV